MDPNEDCYRKPNIVRLDKLYRIPAKINVMREPSDQIITGKNRDDFHHPNPASLVISRKIWDVDFNSRYQRTFFRLTGRKAKIHLVK
jgi:hypothetical protein